MFRIGKSTETESRLAFFQELKGFGVMKLFWNYIVVKAARLCDYIKNHWKVHFKRVNIMVCKLYLNVSEAHELPSHMH